LCLAIIALLIFSIFTIPIPITFSQESDPSSGDQGSSEGTTGSDVNDSDASKDGESNEEPSSEDDSNDESGSDPADSDSGDESEESGSDDQPEEQSGSGNQTGGSEGPADSNSSSESDNSGNQAGDESSADQPAQPSEEPSSAGNQTGTEPVDSESSYPSNESGETEVYVKLEEDGSGIAQLEDDTTKVDFETGSIYFGDTIEEGGTLNMTAQPPEDFVASLLEEELEAMYIQEEGEEFEVSTETGAGYTMEGYVIDIDFENVTLAEEGITLALEYAPGLSDAEEQGIRILHFNHETLVWEVLLNNDDSINGGQEVDAENNIVYGTTYSFSHFVPGSGSTVDPATIDTPVSPTSDNTPTITGTKDAGTEVRLFDFDTDDFLGIDGPNASTTWSITTSTLTDGLHELFAVSTDGVSTSTSAGMEIEIDTGPTAAIATASPSTSDATTTLDATVTDSGTGDSDIAAAEYFIDIDPPGSYGTGVSLSAADGTFDEVTEDITGTIDFTGYDDGMHTVYVHAKDDTDNWGLTTPVIFTLDTTAPPAPVITYPSDDDILASFPDIEGDVAANFLMQWGTFGTGDGEFDGPFDIAVSPDGENFVVDVGNDRVQYWVQDSFILEWDGSEGEAFASPVSIAMDDDGFLFVGDNALQNIQKFDRFGGFYTSWGSSGSGDGQFMNPLGIAATGSDDTAVVYIADTGNHRIQKFDGNGNFTTKWGRNGGDGTSGSADGEFDSPYGVAVDADGNVYVADTGNNRIQKFDSDGNFITKWGSCGCDEGEFNFPRGVAVDIAGDVYVVDELNDRIQKFDSEGGFIAEWGENGTGDGQFDSPHKMGFDELGNSYVVDYNNNRIQKFEADAEDPIIELFDSGDSIGTLDPAPLTGFWLFTPGEEFGNGTYNVTAIVTDAAGNQSPESNSVTFTVEGTVIEVDLSDELAIVFTTESAYQETGSITIRKVELGMDPEVLLPGSAFTITPNPFTLSGSLVVEDNDGNDSDPADGIIEINGVIFSTYRLEESQVPEGYERIVTSHTVAVHSDNPAPLVTVENRVEGEDIEETVEVPPPQLDEEEIEEFEDNGAEVNGEPVDSADDLPPALIAPPEDAGELDPDDVIFTKEADPDATGSDLFIDFSIPTYAGPDESIASEVVYAPPAFVIPGANGSDFVLTPIIEEIFVDMTLLFFPPEETEVTSASIQSIEIEFGEGGGDIGFSFELTADIPEDLPDLDDTEETALFLDVDFVGDIDFSDPDAFASPPEFVIIVSKSLDGLKLEDGCPDIRLYLFNDVTDEWEAIETPERNPADDTASECSYIIHTEHFSKFAIGSVKGSISNVNSPGAGTGGSSRTVLVPKTFSNEYFEINPLTQVSVAETTFLTVNGQPSSEFSVGETVQISNTIYNHKRESQHYVFIVQILDEDGITQSISWSSGLLDKAQEYTTSQSWTTKEAGYYEVRIYVWSEWEKPAPLSTVEVSNLQVSWTGPIESV
jgi:streptogramin lyase